MTNACTEGAFSVAGLLSMAVGAIGGPIGMVVGFLVFSTEPV